MSNLLVDGNNFFIRAFVTTAIQSDNAETKYELWKYLCFDHLLSYAKRFKAKRIVVAIDGGESWRKQVYPFYKYKRKEGREKSAIDWTEFFPIFNDFVQDLKDNIPFRVISVRNCEADDVIGVLSKRIQPTVIISTDIDYNQLIDKHVKQFDPIKKEYRKRKDNFIEICCLHGQSKDNIPNILTPLNENPAEIKIPRFGEKKALKIIESGLEKWLAENNLTERYAQQKTLIDLTHIPDNYVQKINNEYDNYKMPDLDRIYPFFKKHNWRAYLNDISRVENLLMEIY